MLEGYKTKGIGADITSVGCNGQWLTIGIVVDATNGLVLSIEQLKAWLEPILDAVDADGFKKVADLTMLKTLIHSRRPEDQPQLEQMYLRYANARNPGKGQKHDAAYRLRTWKDEYGNIILDGTNNHCERSIGWRIKERYRSMPRV